MGPTLCEFGFSPPWVRLTGVSRLGMYYGFIYMDGEPDGPMIKWTLERGSAENEIVASGTHYDSGTQKTYTLTGTTGDLKGGRVRVDLKIRYTALWSDISMSGHFDLEENSIKGTVTMSNGDRGEFAFKRDPDLVRLYPAPSTIDAKARWKFAKAVILGRIQRQSWSLPYILERIKDRKRYMELAIRDRYYGKDLGYKEYEEYFHLLASLYEADSRFCASLIKKNVSEIPIQYVDGCLWDFWPALNPVNTASLNAMSVVLPSEEHEFFAWIVMTSQQRWTSARNLSVSIP
jgi:hypothetical protein